MKTALLLCTLVVLAVSQAAVVKQAGAELFLGSLRPGDRLLNYAELSAPAFPDRTQIQQVILVGDGTSRINVILAGEAGATQGANIKLISGGLGHNNVTLQATSRPGYGFKYEIGIWGQ